MEMFVPEKVLGGFLLFCFVFFNYRAALSKRPAEQNADSSLTSPGSSGKCAGPGVGAGLCFQLCQEPFQ